MFEKLKHFLNGGGVHVPEHKDTAGLATERLPVPELIIMPMSQHVGAPCDPCVQKGDHVYVGTKIGKAPQKLSMHIYSSVSGTIKDIETKLNMTGKEDTRIYIEPDGLQTIDPNITPPEIHDLDSFIEALENSGIVGLGGAGFPTDIKVLPKNLSEIDTLLINGAECEPYLTTDTREFLECSDSILFGIHQCLQWLGIPKCMICIEDNKPEAIALMQKLTADDEQVSVKVLETKYPQGAQNVLIYNATGRVVPRGARHTSVGVLMLNVTTVSTIGKFIKTGIPLVSKRLTVAGDAILNAKNLEVPIGTRFDDIIAYCGVKEPVKKIIVGGPMMGNAQINIHYVITRQNNGLLCFGEKSTLRPDVTDCIKCGRCVNSCPIGLSPIEIYDTYQRYDAEGLDVLKADLCIGCGTCGFVCPAKRPLTQTVGMAKNYLKQHKKKGA